MLQKLTKSPWETKNTYKVFNWTKEDDSTRIIKMFPEMTKARAYHLQEE